MSVFLLITSKHKGNELFLVSLKLLGKFANKILIFCKTLTFLECCPI